MVGMPDPDPANEPAEMKPRVLDPSGGANQVRVRAYNERLVMSLVRRHEGLSKADIARRSGLSAQTVSVIMRSLERDGLLMRGTPVRGKVGQPSVPMMLNPDGVFSIGLKIGRRSADLVLMDFVGRVRKALHQVYKFPSPDGITGFVREGVDDLTAGLSAAQREKIAGLGIAIPFQLWSWADEIDVDPGAMSVWLDVDLATMIGEIVPYPVFMQNDATAACGAELVFGRGPEFADFAYFFIGTFIGGGVVLNHSLFSGRSGNAGAFGSMPVGGKTFPPEQLIDRASLVVLERMLIEAGIDASCLWLSPDDWGDLGESLDKWIEETSRAMAIAIASVCSVIDFQAVIIDGGFPAGIKHRLVQTIRAETERLDLQGIDSPVICEGAVGASAREIGGASLPLFARYLTDRSVLFKEA